MVGFMELDETTRNSFEARKQRYIDTMVKLYGDEMRQPIEVVDQIWSEVRARKYVLSSCHFLCRKSGLKAALPCSDLMNFL